MHRRLFGWRELDWRWRGRESDHRRRGLRERQKIAMIHNAGYAEAAQDLMCNDKATYFAFRGTDTPVSAP